MSEKLTSVNLIEFPEGMTVKEFIDWIKDKYSKISVDVIAKSHYIKGEITNYIEKYPHSEYRSFLTLTFIDGEIVEIVSYDYSKVSKMEVKRAKVKTSGPWMDYTLELDD